MHSIFVIGTWQISCDMRNFVSLRSKLPGSNSYILIRMPGNQTARNFYTSEFCKKDIVDLFGAISESLCYNEKIWLVLSSLWF